MKKIGLIMACFLLLLGCSKENGGLNKAMELRTSLLNSACRFEATITADFGDKTYTFTMECAADDQGNITFTVLAPESIAGISGTVQSQGGALTFDDTALAFPLEADGLLSPVSGPWVMIQALRSGYIRSCGQEEGLWRVTVDDSFQEDALTLDIWLDEEGLPVRADIYEENRRILAFEVKDFRIG